MSTSPHNGRQVGDAVDSSYFSRYGLLDIHEDMLKDRSRTETYRDAMESPIGKEDFKDSIVLDVGCGTGILALFAARAGAKKVIAVDASDICDYAREIVKLNRLDHIITVVKSRIEDVDLREILNLPKDASHEDSRVVDVVVSEWMGYFLLYESMLHSVVYARDNFLKKGGKMYPSYAKLYLAPLTCPRYYDEHVNFWKNVYGFNLSPLVPAAKKLMCGNEPVVEFIDVDEDASTKPHCIKAVDCLTVTTDELLKWSNTFAFKSCMKTTIHGFAAWFDVYFPSAPQFSTLSSESSVGLSASSSSSLSATYSPHLSATLRPSKDTMQVLLETLRERVARNRAAKRRHGDDVQDHDVDDGRKRLKNVKSCEGRHEYSEAEDECNPPRHFTGILSTSPTAASTHWAQLLFFVDEPWDVELDDKITGRIDVVDDKPARTLNVHLKWLSQPSGHMDVVTGAKDFVLR